MEGSIDCMGLRFKRGSLKRYREAQGRGKEGYSVYELVGSRDAERKMLEMFGHRWMLNVVDETGLFFRFEDCLRYEGRMAKSAEPFDLATLKDAMEWVKDKICAVFVCTGCGLFYWERNRMLFHVNGKTDCRESPTALHNLHKRKEWMEQFAEEDLVEYRLRTEGFGR